MLSTMDASSLATVPQVREASSVPRSPSPPFDLSQALELVAPLAQARTELCAFVYLDKERRLLGLRHQASPRTDTITVGIREIVRDALSYDARYLLMAHNHPSGDATPSRDDMAFTHRLTRLLDAIGITLIDHLIVSANATTSFRQKGLL